MNIMYEHVGARSVLRLGQHRGRARERDAGETSRGVLLGQARSAPIQRRHAGSRHLRR